MVLISYWMLKKGAKRHDYLLILNNDYLSMCIGRTLIKLPPPIASEQARASNAQNGSIQIWDIWALCLDGGRTVDRVIQLMVWSLWSAI